MFTIRHHINNIQYQTYYVFSKKIKLCIKDIVTDQNIVVNTYVYSSITV